MQVFLERGRVISQPWGESSFHVFYLLFASMRGGVTSSNEVHLDPLEAHRYVDPSTRLHTEEQRQQLLRQYHSLTEDMARVGIDSKAQRNVFRTLAAIVLLGNVQFRKKDADRGTSLSSNPDDTECIVDPSHDTSALSIYLGVEDINQLLTTKVILGGRSASFYQVSLTGAQARANADNLATGLYYKLFGWLVTVSNSTSKLSGDLSESASRRMSSANNSNYVGVLDVCGFEVNDSNGFEQLCVNYCNEKLYSVLYTEIFESELTLLADEGCPHKVSGGYDNASCLSLLDGETGLMRLIDEHCLLSRAGMDDRSLLALFCQHHPKHPHFECALLAKRRSVGETRFKIKHFRGTVTYYISGFTSSNGEKVEIDSMLGSSTNEFILALNVLKVESPGDGSATNAASVRKASMSGTFVPRNNRRNVKKGKLTVSSEVRSNLAAFVGELQSTEIQFITCVKPNRSQTQDSFASDYVLQQLQAFGVIDMMRMHTEGYALNMSWQELDDKLQGMNLRPSIRKAPASLMDIIQAIKDMFTAVLPPHMWFVGSSGRVFLKSSVFKELMRQKTQNSARTIQKSWKVHRLCVKSRKLFVSLVVIKGALLRYVNALRKAKALARLEEMCRKYAYLLLRWRLNMRLEKRTSAKVAIWFLRRIMWKHTITRIIHAQAIISNILQTKRLQWRHCKAKWVTVVLQKCVRGMLCRKSVAPLLNKLRQKMWTLKCRKCATMIYRYECKPLTFIRL